MNPNVYFSHINSALKTFCETEWPIKAKELVRSINSVYSLVLPLEVQPIDSSKLLVFDGTDCYYDSQVLLKSIGIDNGVLEKFHSNITENIVTSITNWFIEQFDMYIFGIHVDSRPVTPEGLFIQKKPYVKQIILQTMTPKQPTTKGQSYTLRNCDDTVYEVSQFLTPNGDIIGDTIANKPNHHSIVIRNTVGGFSMVEDSVLVE